MLKLTSNVAGDFDIASFYGLTLKAEYLNGTGPGGAWNAGTKFTLGRGYNNAILQFYIPADCSGLWVYMTGHLGSTDWRRII